MSVVEKKWVKATFTVTLRIGDFDCWNNIDIQPEFSLRIILFKSATITFFTLFFVTDNRLIQLMRKKRSLLQKVSLSCRKGNVPLDDRVRAGHGTNSFISFIILLLHLWGWIWMWVKRGECDWKSRSNCCKIEISTLQSVHAISNNHKRIIGSFV